MVEIKNDFRSEDFSKKVAKDLEAVGMKELLEKGGFELVMKPLESKKLFSNNLEIIENLKSVKNDLDYDFPIVGNRRELRPNNKTELVENDEVHSVVIDEGKDEIFSTNKEWYETFSTFTDGLFMFQRSYVSDWHYSDRLHVPFVSIANFVRDSLMFAKQFYDGRLGKNDKISFEWKLTKTKDREITPPTPSDRMCIYTHNCEEEEIVLQRTYEYGELEDCINYSAEIVGEICENFGTERERWACHAKAQYEKKSF